MNEQTFNRRLQQLKLQIYNHSQRDELLRLMAEQVAEDTKIVA
tara:strand:- start:1738 stop:1866 length:129 start_codon:yes stop_codon:yes gene_type:complete